MSTMNKIAAAVVLLALGGVAGWGLSTWTGTHSMAPTDTAGAAAPAAERKVLFWYDPMVPTQRFDKPGKSPFMDMELVPRYADEGAAAGGAPGVSVSPQAMQALGVRLATAERRALGSAIETVATVQLNERDISIVQARAAGFVERVYARAPGDVIAAGAPLVDLFHPEWLAAQQEYLAVRATGDAGLAAATKQRLVLLGMPAALIERVAAGGQPVAVTTVTVPTGGLISELMVRTGMTVDAGMTLARINGLGTVWLEAALPEVQAAGIATGQVALVRVAALPGQSLRGKVAAVLPEINAETRTLRLRIELPNPGQRLRAGMFAQVTLQGPASGDAVVLPSEAVIRTGRRALVYVQDAPGRFRPVEVELGPEVDGQVVIRSGITAGQQVVASGQFLIDSEASMQGVMARAEPVAGAAMEYPATGVVVELDPDSITLDHAPVPALKWPAMTMPFQWAKPELAQGLKPGDRVEFSFRQEGDEHIVTRIQPAAAPAAAPPAIPPVSTPPAAAPAVNHSGHTGGKP
ncbi:MAG: efflux RND transporter periplasmic adaptor subunit [Rubrivivax sp.]|nr:efflux RND transporter periplasmic adaptor subunit [Rubrivivax sp.]